MSCSRLRAWQRLIKVCTSIPDKLLFSLALAARSSFGPKACLQAKTFENRITYTGYVCAVFHFVKVNIRDVFLFIYPGAFFLFYYWRTQAPNQWSRADLFVRCIFQGTEHAIHTMPCVAQTPTCGILHNDTKALVVIEKQNTC